MAARSPEKSNSRIPWFQGSFLKDSVASRNLRRRRASAEGPLLGGGRQGEVCLVGHPPWCERPREPRSLERLPGLGRSLQRAALFVRKNPACYSTLIPFDVRVAGERNAAFCDG